MAEENLPTVNPPNSPDFDGVSGKEADILNAGETSETSEDETPPDENEETVEETEESDEKPEVTDEEESEETEESEDEEKELSPNTPPFNQLRKEFPEVFKKYPQIQANFFKAEKYAEYFPTVEDAETAARKSEIFDTFDESVTQGELGEVINAIKSTNPNALTKVADTILPMLGEANPQLYIRAINPVFRTLLQTAVNKAGEIKDDNLKNAAIVMANFIYGPAGIPKEDPATMYREDPKVKQLEDERNNLVIQQASNFESSVKEDTYKLLKAEIEKDLDPENKLTQFTKNKLIEEIIVSTNQRIAKDPASKKLFQSHWANAAKNGFRDDLKPSIKRAFLGRAKMILPGIKSKLYAEAIGTVPKVKGKTIVPTNSAPSRTKSKVITPKEAKQKRLSEMDIINGA